LDFTAAFTLIEIAISLAIIGFALVAIIGVLPTGMNVQRENREETTINQEESIFMDAIRNGNQGLDYLTNHVVAITNRTTVWNWQGGGWKRGREWVSGYTYYDSSSGYPSDLGSYNPLPITNGFRIIGLLSTPKYIWFDSGSKLGGASFYSNHVVAYVRSMSGVASDQVSPSLKQGVSPVPDLASGLAFSYRLIPSVMTNAAYFNPTNISIVVSNLQANLHELRLTFRWPLLPNGEAPDKGGRLVFRTTAGGVLFRTNDVGIADQPGKPNPDYLYFFQPRTYAQAP
jgi:type II secretory pathway pseudopilin PulG